MVVNQLILHPFKKVIKSQPSNWTFFENICRLEILLWDSMGISEEIEDATISAVETKISRLKRRSKNLRDQIEYSSLLSREE